MGAANDGADQGGCVLPDLESDILGGGTVSYVVQFGEVDDDPLHWGGIGWIPSQVGPQADGEANLVKEVLRVGIPPSGGCYGGGGTSRSEDLCLLSLEHSRAVYCDQAHYGPVSSSGLETRSKVVQEVVGTGQVVCVGDSDSGLGGGTDGVGGRRRTGRRWKQTKSVGGQCSDCNLRDGS